MSEKKDSSSEEAKIRPVVKVSKIGDSSPVAFVPTPKLPDKENAK